MSNGQDGSLSGVYGKTFAPETIGGDAAGDTLTGIEHLTGSAHDDRLTGDAGANRLTGGAGADVFVFAGFDGDSITDFQDGVDHIDLRGTDATFADLTIADSAADVTVTWNGGTLTPHRGGSCAADGG